VQVTGRDVPARSQLATSLALLAASLASLVAAPSIAGLFGGLLAALMIAIAAIDARHYLIPDPLTATAALLGMLRACLLASDGWLGAVLWVVLRGIIVALPLLILMMAYRKARGVDGLGLGDVKLAAVAGIWLEITTVFIAIEIAALSALAAYLATSLLRRRRARATAAMPFGLFLAPAIWVGWLVEAGVFDQL
jgi:leader peptidase (prepilin peptidase)/N-methyltransferase